MRAIIISNNQPQFCDATYEYLISKGDELIVFTKPDKCFALGKSTSCKYLDIDRARRSYYGITRSPFRASPYTIMCWDNKTWQQLVISRDENIKEMVLDKLVRILKGLGIIVKINNNDIEHNGKKIAAVCCNKFDDVYACWFFIANYKQDIRLMDKVYKLPKEKHGGLKPSERVTSIEDVLGERVWDLLGIIMSEFDVDSQIIVKEKMLSEIRELSKKYTKKEWVLYGRPV